MSKVLQNTTGSNIEIESLGISIAASSSFTVPVLEYNLLASSDSVLELTPLITSGDIVVSGLPAALGLAYIQYPDDAGNILFDNSTNGFVSIDVQSAIEEARDTAAGGTDHHAGFYRVDDDTEVVDAKQMRIKGVLELNAILTLNGQLVID